MDKFQIYEFLSPILMALLTWVGHHAASLLKAKTKSQKVRDMIDRFDDAIIVAVKHTNQTIKRQIKAAAADGVITDEEKAKLKEATLQSVKDQFGGFAGVATALKVAGISGDSAVAGFVKERIEAHVHDEKARNRP